MAFFTNERIKNWKQQAKNLKDSYDGYKEQWTEEKRKLQAERNYQNEKRSKFEGTALQPVGVIPKGAEVTLKLDPDTEILSIKYDETINMRLPYERVLGFRLECITEEMVDNNTVIASLVLSSGLLGPGLVGKAGKLAGAILAGKKKKKAVWVGTLIYNDKEGITQELSFAGNAKEFDEEDTPKDYESKQFEHIVNGIAMKSNQDSMEL